MRRLSPNRSWLVCYLGSFRSYFARTPTGMDVLQGLTLMRPGSWVYFCVAGSAFAQGDASKFFDRFGIGVFVASRNWRAMSTEPCYREPILIQC